MRAVKKVVGRVEPIPEGYHTITPGLTLRGADRAIDFYKKCFDAEELDRVTGPDGKTVVHAALRIGDSVFFVGEEIPGMGCGAPETYGGSPVSLYLYVEDVDASAKKAEAAGAKILMPPTDMFWGDRYARLSDPFGYEWGLGTRVVELSPQEIQKAAHEFFRKQGGGASG